VNIVESKEARCRRCGATKRSRLRHPRLLYELVKVFGYRLYRCSGCRHFLLVKRQPETAPARSPVVSPPDREATPKPANACPECGSTQYRRSHRKLSERLAKKGPMVRCRICRHRFPQPAVNAPSEAKQSEQQPASP
jgi:DNA-directed RNA polymerase subunit RPC12/RpoP